MILKDQGGMIAFGVMNRLKLDLAHNLGGKQRNTADTLLSVSGFTLQSNIVTRTQTQPTATANVSLNV